MNLENSNPASGTTGVALAANEADTKVTRIRIPSQVVCQATQERAPAPTRVQPVRNNKGNRMAALMERMEEDDDATTSNPGRKRNIRRVEDEQPEDLGDVPEGASLNPMAPLAKRHKRGRMQEGQSLMMMPPPMPLHAPVPIKARPPLGKSNS